MPTVTVKATAITKVMRGLFPQVTMSTTAGPEPGQYTLRLPERSARDCLGNSGSRWLEDYLSRHLGQPVRVTRVAWSRSVRGNRAAITLDVTP